MNMSSAALSTASNGALGADASSLQHMQLASLFSNPITAQLLASSGVQFQTHAPAQASPQFQQQQSLPPTTMNGTALAALLGAQQPQAAAGGVQLGQLLADAMRLSTPVGTYPDDEDRLVDALYESEKKGTTYRRALDELHGVNNHAANMWKDYYLDHTPRINDLVARKRKPLVTKKPFFDPVGRPRATSDSHSFQAVGPSSSSKMRSPGSEKHRGAPVSRRTSSSTLHEPSTSARRVSKTHLKPNAAVGTMRLPRRSPTPPTKVITSARGAKFTDEDQAYFVAYVNYRWATDPGLSKAEICAELAEKCPHHTANSWQSHWAYRRDQYENLVPSSGSHEGEGRREKGMNGDVESEGSAYEQDSDGRSQSESYSDDDDDGTPAPEVADLDKMAEYIVSVGAEWDELKRREQWEPFHLQYPHRTWSAWAERYRQHKPAVDKMIADMIRAKNSVREQRAVPSWAKDRSPPHSDTHKRIASNGRQDEVESRENKRLKTEREGSA